MRPGCEQSDRDAAPHVRPFRLVPADGGGDLLDVADEVRVERLAAGPELLAGRAEVRPAQLERVDAAAPRDLVDLRLRDPLEMRRAERPVGARRGRVRVDARGVHPVGGEAVGTRRRVARRWR